MQKSFAKLLNTSVAIVNKIINVYLWSTEKKIFSSSAFAEAQRKVFFFIKSCMKIIQPETNGNTLLSLMKCGFTQITAAKIIIYYQKIDKKISEPSSY